MAKKKRARASTAKKASVPRSFSGVIRGRSRPVQRLATALRELVLEEIWNAEESFYGGQKPMAMYRTVADICWVQPLTNRCNIYFTRGTDLRDDAGILEGSSDRIRHVKVKSVEAIDELPLRDFIRESIELNALAVSAGLTFDEVLKRLRDMCLSLPQTKETLTWGKPHFRVGEKIFCGCGEDKGEPIIGLKLDAAEAKTMMTVPGIGKAAYSRPNDGWISVKPNVFDDWEEINTMIVDSFRLIAPTRVSALLPE